MFIEQSFQEVYNTDVVCFSLGVAFLTSSPREFSVTINERTEVLTRRMEAY